MIDFPAFFAHRVPEDPGTGSKKGVAITRTDQSTCESESPCDFQLVPITCSQNFKEYLIYLNIVFS